MKTPAPILNNREKLLVVILSLALTAIIVLVVHLALDLQTDPHFGFKVTP